MCSETARRSRAGITGQTQDMSDTAEHAGDGRLAADTALVRAFVRKHYSWRGSLRLHRASLGPDLLRAPVNVALAPVFLLVRLAALVLTGLRLRRVGRWLSARRILLRSDASRGVERALVDEVLRARMPGRGPLSPAAARLVEDYVGIRNAVAEIVTSCIVLGIGLLAFRAATPGVFSLAPRVSDQAARAMAVSDFPLGRGLGQVWYGVFPVDLPAWFVLGTAALLVVAASVVTTFAGLLADPVQLGLGIHRRRLMRLLNRLDRADGGAPGIAREHLLARLADLGDIATALVRALRP
jgi:hypothetical protein